MTQAKMQTPEKPEVQLELGGKTYTLCADGHFKYFFGTKEKEHKEGSDFVKICITLWALAHRHHPKRTPEYYADFVTEENIEKINSGLSKALDLAAAEQKKT